VLDGLGTAVVESAACLRVQYLSGTTSFRLVLVHESRSPWSWMCANSDTHWPAVGSVENPDGIEPQVVVGELVFGPTQSCEPEMLTTRPV
jgi:hypothetical protein